jgi:hypothetical protein
MSFDEMRSQEEYFGGATAIPAIPRDNFANMILEAAVCHSQLEGVLPTMNFDVGAGVGGVVQVPMIAARIGQGPFTTDCHCLVHASSVITKATVTIRAWGDYELMCEFPLWKATTGVKEAIINEMGKGLANKLDQWVWFSLVTAGFRPGHTVKTTVSCGSTATFTSSCCNYRYDLYNSIVSVKAEMEGACYEPDYLILNPTVGAWFKKAWAMTVPELVTIGANGKLENVAGLKVIESGSAAACGNNTGVALPTMAVIVDSKRALAEAWGKRPTWEEVRDPHCDQFQEVVWLYWGIQRVDRLAISHIRNPGAG